jgi:hypothetical protein
MTGGTGSIGSKAHRANLRVWRTIMAAEFADDLIGRKSEERTDDPKRSGRPEMHNRPAPGTLRYVNAYLGAGDVISPANRMRQSLRDWDLPRQEWRVDNLPPRKGDT